MCAMDKICFNYYSSATNYGLIGLPDRLRYFT